MPTAGHAPAYSIVYANGNALKLASLANSTASGGAGGVTLKDVALAEAIDRLT